MIKRLTLLLGLLAAAPTHLASAEPVPQRLELAQALARARHHSPKLKDREDEIAAAQLRLAQAQARGMPRVSVSLRYTRVNHVDPAQISVASPVPGIPAPPPVQLGEAVDNQAAMRLSVDQPVYVGGAIAAAKEAGEHLASAARERKRQEFADLDLRVEEAFLEALQANQNLEVAARSERLLRNLHRDALQRDKAGVGTPLEMARSAARLAAAEAALLQVQTARDLANIALAVLLGLPLDSEFTLVDPPLPDEAIAGEAVLLQQAERQRPELGLARSQAAAQTARARGESSALYPQVWLRGGISYDRPNQRNFPIREQFDPSWDVSAVASWSWDWGGTAKAARAAALDTAVAHRQIEALGEAVRMEVARARRLALTARSRVAAVEAAVAAAEAALHRASELCSAGHTSCIHVLDAERDLSQAQAERVRARAEVRISYSRLLRAIGESR